MKIEQITKADAGFIRELRDQASERHLVPTFYDHKNGQQQYFGIHFFEAKFGYLQYNLMLN